VIGAIRVVTSLTRSVSLLLYKLQLVEQLDRRNRLPNILSLRAIPKNGVAIPMDFREKSADLEEIATPACALVRDDMRFR